jgi:hypothetical protein
MAHAKTDPELLRQLAEVATPSDPVAAVFVLRPTDPSEPVPGPAETEEVVQRLLERVTQEVGVPPQRVNIFRNLGSFVVSATTPFVRKLLEQREIASALPNRRPLQPQE